jgi:hypothetical protein
VLQKSRSSDFLRNKKPMQQAGATERALKKRPTNDGTAAQHSPMLLSAGRDSRSDLFGQGDFAVSELKSLKLQQ